DQRRAPGAALLCGHDARDLVAGSLVRLDDHPGDRAGLSRVLCPTRLEAEKRGTSASPSTRPEWPGRSIDRQRDGVRPPRGRQTRTNCASLSLPDTTVRNGRPGKTEEGTSLSNSSRRSLWRS